MPTSSRPTDAVATVRVRVVAAAGDDLLGREFVLTAAPIVVGRADDCDFPVADKSMSRRHARLEATADGARVVDNGSANGVIVDGARVSEIALGAGGQFRLGQTTFEVVVEWPAEPPPEPPRAYEPSPLFERTAAIQDIQAMVAAMARPKSLAEEGEQVITAANRPMVLADPEAFYLVESGKVEIFTVQLEAGQPVGARSHFVTIDAGQAFFGMDTDRYGMGSGFLAVGKAGSELRKYDTARLVRLAGAAEHQARIGEAVATWVEALSRRLVKDLPTVPSVELAAAAGQTLKVEVGKRIGNDRAVVWAEMPAGQFLFDGMASLSWEIEGVLFPFAPGSWLELLGGLDSFDCTPLTTAAAIGDPRLWAGLEVFHRILCECEFLNKKLAVADEFLRLKDKAEQVAAAQEEAYNAIGSVLGGTGVWARAAPSADSEPIFRVCQLVGERMGVTFRDFPDSREVRSFEESILGIALVSRLRARRVALADDWWRHDQGPLLGQLEESKAPVALLPTSPTSYEAVDPSGE